MSSGRSLAGFAGSHPIKEINQKLSTRSRGAGQRGFNHNAVWLELSLIAQDVIAWTQQLAFTGELATCEPKTLRYRLLHTAARLAFHARRATLRLQRSWPWADALAAAFTRLAALPPPAR